MSLLEDVFLQDEANEAQELERVIEGDEFERPRSLSPSEDESDGEKREDEAEEDKRRVDPNSTKTKKVTKNPRFVLNPARLTGPRGIQVIPEHFKDFKFRGKGHEKEDLDMVLKKLEHWAYRLYPKFEFSDCLKKIETLGRKRPVMVHLHKIRTDQFMSEETVVQKDSSDDEAVPAQDEDEFDKLLRQQIELSRATPAPDSVKKGLKDRWDRLVGTPGHDDRSSQMMPKATSSPSISDEQKERMLRNRKLAEERRLARLKQTTNTNGTISNTIIEIDEQEPSTNISNMGNENEKKAKQNKENNRSNVIDSSDSEDDVSAVNTSIIVDVHNVTSKNNEKLEDKDKTISDEVMIDDQINKSSDKNVNVCEKNNEDNIDDKIVANDNEIESDNHVMEENNDKNIESGDKIVTSDKENESNDHIMEENTDINNDDNNTEIRLRNNDECEKNRNTEELGVIDTEIGKLSNLSDNNANKNSNEDENIMINDKFEVNGKKNGNIKQVDEEAITDVMDIDFSDDF